MDWVLTRPFGWAALALPILVLVFARLRSRPPQVAIGSLRHWRERDAASRDRERPRSGWSTTLVLFVAGLVAGVLALSGPQIGARARVRTTILVDRSPSMWLPVDPARADAPTRYAVALQAWFALGRPVGERTLWTTLDEGRWVEHEGVEPPATWSHPDRSEREIPFETFDRADVVWITDRPRAARLATVVASGGAAVPGPIAAVRMGTAGRRLVWRDGRVDEEPWRAPEERVYLAAHLAEPVAEVVAAWAAMRGLSLTGDRAAADVLCVEGPTEDTTVTMAEPFVAAGNGWSLEGPIGTFAQPGPMDGTRVVARAGEREALGLIAAAGQLRCAFGPGTRVGGDAARFAADLASTCDRVARLPAGVVALAERRSAGAGGTWSAPHSTSGGVVGTGRHRLEASAAWGAVALLAAAFVSDRLRRRPRRRSRARPAAHSAS